MSAFQQVVSPTASYPAFAAPSATCPFEPTEWELVEESGTAVDISFDGVNNHDHLAGGGRTTVRGRSDRVWLKGAGASVRVKARTDV